MQIELRGDPWETDGPWLLLLSAAGFGRQRQSDALTVSRRFRWTDVGPAFDALVEGYTWSSAHFMLARVCWRERAGVRTRVPSEPPPTADAFAGACPWWNNGAAPTTNFNLRLEHDDDALELEGVLTLFWHIHM